MTSPFHTTRRVEFSDTDMAGIVHFASFFRFMEGAEHEFLRSVGLSVVLNWEGVSLGFPRVSASCDFLKPIRFEDVVDIEVPPGADRDQVVDLRVHLSPGRSGGSSGTHQLRLLPD